MKTFSSLGRGVSRVVELQQYSAVFNRGIVANHEVYRQVSDAPRSRLLAVDVLSFSSTVSIREETIDTATESQGSNEKLLDKQEDGGMSGELVYQVTSR